MAVYRKISDATRKRVESLIRKGVTYSEVKRRTGVSETYACKVAHEIGEGDRKNRRKSDTRKKVHAEAVNGGSHRDVARRLGIPLSTVHSHMTEVMPEESQPEHGVGFPEAVSREWRPFHLDRPGHWLVFGDIHLPCHDRTVIELAVRQAKRDGAVGVILNGDVMDCHELSSHDKDPSMPRYVE
ncbi:MAG: hypothetical protein VKJ09_15805, partial [Leptolyngbya sp.]|nr:hypothetical protein [Leptolyngbya sp.]